MPHFVVGVTYVLTSSPTSTITSPINLLLTCRLYSRPLFSVGLSQRALSRAFSGQSDSSGFVDAEMGEIDWTQLKVGLGLPSTGEYSKYNLL